MNKNDVKQIADRHGLPIREDSIKLNQSGVDFLAAHAEDLNGEKWILRIPRRQESMRHAEREKALLEIVRKYAGFEVPHWSYFSKDFIAYKQLRGKPAAVIDIELQDYVWELDNKNVPDEFHISLGKVMAELHSLPREECRDIGVEFSDRDELRSAMKQRMDSVKEHYNINQKLWNRWQTWLGNDPLWPAHTGVTHGDLHPGHILINDKSQVTGLIDWTEAGVGDVSVDFLSHHLIFGEEGLSKLIEAYERAGGKTWEGMTEHIVELQTTSGITVAEYAEVSGLSGMKEAAVKMLSEES